MKRFALIGAAGYVSPRHMEAIALTGNNLVAAIDPHDSVGILDKYFPKAQFFTEFERFDRYCDKLRREGKGIDYVSICSPNYLHDAHCRFALRIGADVICEKPLVLRERNLDALKELEGETNKRIYTIMQLRLSAPLIKLRRNISEGKYKEPTVNVKYVTPRGPWYHYSWKGDIEKSGGLATNIGIHLFDLLIWLFGEIDRPPVIIGGNKNTVKGFLKFQSFIVRYILSITGDPIRYIEIGGKQIEFSSGFTALHVTSYRKILAGKGFGIEDARPAIRLCEELRNQY